MANDQSHGDDAAQARERRLQALRSLAQQGRVSGREEPATAEGSAPDVGTATDGAQHGGREPSEWPPASVVARIPQCSRRRLLAVVASAALAVLVVAGLALHSVAGTPGHATGGALPAAVSIVTSHSGLACPSNVAWSPDGKRVAVVGYAKLCPSEFPTNYQYEPGVVVIYDAATGRPLDTFHPDKAVHDTPGVPTPGSVTPAASYADTSEQVVDYSEVLWSPDGKRLALVFAVSTYRVVTSSTGNTVEPSGGLNGLEVVNVDGSSPEVLTYKSNGQYFGAVRWDLSSGKATAVNPIPANTFASSSLPASLSYSWNGDTLTPDAPLGGGVEPSTAALGPVGNPDGGASFSIWQNGSATYENQAFLNNQQVTENPGAFVFGTDFTAWSPDGRYVLDPVYLQGLVQPEGRLAPSARALDDMGLRTVVRLPMRDPAMGRAFASIQIATSSATSLSLAWRPDGRVLAVQAQPQGPQQPYDNTITFYDCRTGATLGTLKPSFSLRGSDLGSGFVGALRWSPDGSHLLSLDAESATITVWGPGKLSQ